MAKKSSKKAPATLGPWRIDGISPEAVAAAGDAAERAGVPLAVWLERLIRETAKRERHERRSRGAA